MNRNGFHGSIRHPLFLNSFRLWLRLWRMSGGIDSNQVHRAALITLLSPVSAPFRLLESAVYGSRVKKLAIEKPPVFILGHWRSGTTLLHNLLCQDPNFAYVPLYQTIVPTSHLVTRPIFGPIMQYFTPATRPMDNVPLAINLPQEEELAVAHQCPYSPYLGWYFPKRMQKLFHQYALMEDISDEVLAKWRTVYTSVLKKATFAAQGRRLVIKNPVNTCRITELLKLFPGAKFIHIHRNPYVVFKSTQHLYRSVLGFVSLQSISQAEMDNNILHIYREMMKRFIHDRSCIPKENFFELRYDDFEPKPVESLARIYEALDLPGWGEAKTKMCAYLDEQGPYKKNAFTIERCDIERIDEHWGFALNEWGYQRPALEPAV